MRSVLLLLLFCIVGCSAREFILLDAPSQLPMDRMRKVLFLGYFPPTLFPNAQKEATAISDLLFGQLKQTELFNIRFAPPKGYDPTLFTLWEEMKNMDWILLGSIEPPHLRLQELPPEPIEIEPTDPQKEGPTYVWQSKSEMSVQIDVTTLLLSAETGETIWKDRRISMERVHIPLSFSYTKQSIPPVVLPAEPLSEDTKKMLEKIEKRVLLKAMYSLLQQLLPRYGYK